MHIWTFMEAHVKWAWLERARGQRGATSNEAARANFPGNCSQSGNVYKLLAGMRRYARYLCDPPRDPFYLRVYVDCTALTDHAPLNPNFLYNFAYKTFLA